MHSAIVFRSQKILTTKRNENHSQLQEPNMEKAILKLRNDFSKKVVAFAIADSEKEASNESLAAQARSYIIERLALQLPRDKDGNLTSTVITWDKDKPEVMRQFMDDVSVFAGDIVKAMPDGSKHNVSGKGNTLNRLITALNDTVKVKGYKRFSVSPTNRPKYDAVVSGEKAYEYGYTLEEMEKETAEVKQTKATQAVSALETLITDDPSVLLKQLVDLHGFEKILEELGKLNHMVKIA